MGFDRYPPGWQSSRERSASPMSSSIKVSRRSRTIVLILAAFVCTWFLSGFVTSLPQQYSHFEQHADRVKTPPADQHEHHVVIDGKAFVSSEVETQKDYLAGAKIAKITMLYGDSNPTYERALQSHENHAKLHHYPLFILRQKLLGRLWSKPAYIMSIILRELEKPNPKDRLQWLFWFDADTFLLNQKIPLETFLPPKEMPHIKFMCGNDHNGLNDGSFFMRVDEWTLHLMAAAISLEELRPEVSLKYSEQSAIEHLVKHVPFYVNHTAIVPQRWYNAFMGPRKWDGHIKPNRQITGGSVQEGDLLVHFAGSGDTKKGRMTKFMNAFEKNREQWELDVKETEILNEMKEFWEGWAAFEKERDEKGLPMPDKSVKSPGAGTKDGERLLEDVKADQKASQQADDTLEADERPRRRW
jgi:hypothetical protein